MKKNYFKNLMQVSLLLGAAFVISSCDDIVGQEDNPVASYVQWQAKTPEKVTLKIDETYTVKATAVSSAIIVYESENPEIAKVDPVTGEITAVAVGETNINAVITGASSAGQSVFTPEKISIKVIVKDGKVSLKAKAAEKVQTINTVDAATEIDCSKFFDVYPETGNTITYSLLHHNNPTGKKITDYAVAGGELGSITSAGVYTQGSNKKDTIVYVVAEITGKADGFDWALDAKKNHINHVDTIAINIKESIAYINAKGEREILTADKYKTDIDFTKPIEAGTYYVDNSYWDTSTNVVIKGNVTLISTGKSLGVNTLTDQTDNATLKIFGEAINTATKGEYNTANPYIYVQGDNGDGISNFNQIDFYTGDIYVRTSKANCGAFENVKNINVFGGYLDARNSSSGYAINLKEGGKFTVDGGAAFAAAAGEDTKVSFAIVGDVNVKSLSKTGDFTAESAYRAVKGNVTKGDKIKLYNDEDKEIQDNSGNPKKITTVAPVAP